MPTFATAPLHNLYKNNRPDSNEDSGELTRINGAPRHLYISPALYATPEQAPIPESPLQGPISPSPYVANHKRRRGGKNETRRAEAAETADFAGDELNLDEAVADNFRNESLNENRDDEKEEEEEEEEIEGFLGPPSEAVSLGCEVEANDLGVGSQSESRSLVSAQGDFFDANDDFSSDSSNSNAPSSSSRVELELHSLKVSIADEMERRKAADDRLMLMRSQWEKVRNLMSEAGLTFPAPPPSDNMQVEKDSIDQFSKEVVVGRFVAEAVGRGQARAEAEDAAARMIESKDQELLRLRDRLQYYETVNHELSRRKLVEVAQRQQLKRRHRRWLGGLMGLSIAMGVCFVAYSYIPHTGRVLSSLESVDSSDASRVSSSYAT